MSVAIMAEQPITRPTDPETSSQAAAAVDRRGHKRLVEFAFRTHGPLDLVRLVEIVGGMMSPESARGRTAELVAEGTLQRVGRRLRRRGLRSRWFAVFDVVERRPAGSLPR